MTPPAPKASITLSIFPTARGMGWVAFNGPFAVEGSGLFTVLHNKNGACLNEANRIMARFRPDTVVLEAFDAQRSKRAERIGQLCDSIAALTTDRGHEIAIFTRDHVRAAFASVRAVTRDEIAAAVAASVPAIAHRLPPKRKVGESEDKRLAMFNAAALVLTHFHFGSLGLLEDLKVAA
jgi:hypothetical protein